MRYKISRLAVQDLENIWVYTFEKWSINQADKYINQIMDEIEYIANHPKSGSDFSRIRKGYFRTMINAHLIFYKIDKKNDMVEIIRILHQKMDIEERLSDE